MTKGGIMATKEFLNLAIKTRTTEDAEGRKEKELESLKELWRLIVDRISQGRNFSGMTRQIKMKADSPASVMIVGISTDSYSLDDDGNFDDEGRPIAEVKEALEEISAQGEKIDHFRWMTTKASSVSI